MENAKPQEILRTEGYAPSMPKIMEMTDTLCSVKVLESLRKAGAEYAFVKKGPFRVVGRRRVTPDGGGAWGAARSDGSLKRMEDMNTGNPFLGLCFGFQADGSNDNMVAMEYAEPLEGLESFEYPAHEWLIYTLSGQISEDVLGNGWWYINNKLLDELGLEKDNLPTIECYLEWDDKADRCSIEICIPYRRKESEATLAAAKPLS